MKWKTRDKKQGVSFTWQEMRSRPLSQWFHERFGVHACATQLLTRSDLHQDVSLTSLATYGFRAPGRDDFFVEGRTAA